MKEADFPTLRDCDEHLSELIASNRDQRYRVITWLGSVVSAFSILAWFAIGLLEQSPEFLQPTSLLALAVLVYIVFLYVNALLPKGVAGVLEAVTGTVYTEDPKLQWSVIKANIPQLREDLVLRQIGDLVVAAFLFVLFLGTGPTVAILALGVGVLRVGLAIGLMALLLSVFHEPVLERLKTMLVKLDQTFQKSQQFQVFLFKAWRVVEVAGVTGKTLLYAPQVLAVFLIYVSFGESIWEALRIALVLVALTFLGVLARHLWGQVGDNLEENSAWAKLRGRILARQYTTAIELLIDFRNELERIATTRATPYIIPQDVLDRLHGLSNIERPPSR